MSATAQNSLRAARSMTPRGRKTRETLLEAALEVFKEQGFYAASVAEINRRSGVSQGTFYQYFSSKDQLLLELVDRIVAGFWQKAHILDIENMDPHRRLQEVVHLLFEHTRDHFEFHFILGELDLIDPVTVTYWDSIARYYRGFIREEAAAGHLRPLDPNLFAYGLLGMAHFSFPDWGSKVPPMETEKAAQNTVDLIRNGISGSAPWQPADGSEDAAPFQEDEPAPATQEVAQTQGQKTRMQILHAAERIFGQMGYNRASIADITRAAGVAQGTFYVHFKSKLELLEGVIVYLGRSLRHSLSRITKGCKDQRDAERQGMLAFFDFVRQHRELYRVVGECESISPATAKMYYRRMADRYLLNVQQGKQLDQVRDLPARFLVRSLMGFGHMIGLKWLIWTNSPHAEIPAHLVSEATEFVIFGLDPS